jgi:hypothetical protein
MGLLELTVPFAAVAWLNATLRVSNAHAGRELAWRPRFTTIREGIRDFVKTNDNQAP